MLRKILVTLDGSSYSEAALPVAAELAAAVGAGVVLLTVSHVPGATLEREEMVELVPMRGAIPPSHYGETRSQAIERRETELAEQLSETAAGFIRGVPIETQVLFGDDPAEAIVEYARAQAVDMIVMTTHGHTGLRSVLFGSVAGKVLGSGVCPVLLVRPRELGEYES